MNYVSGIHRPIIILCLIPIIISCQHKQTDPTTAISKNIDSEMIRLADINIERLKISQQYLGDFFDKRYSDLIHEYETTTDAVKKVNLLDRLAIEDKFSSGDKPSPQETRQQTKTGYPGILKDIAAQNFDLAVRSNDAFVAQVKFISTKFKNMDQSAVDAISFYEQLTPEQKKQYFNVASNSKMQGAFPVPDYKEYLSRELLRGYYHYQYFLQALFYNFYKQKTQNLLRGFQGNEGRQTNGSQSSFTPKNDKQFDIAMAGRH